MDIAFLGDIPGFASLLVFAVPAISIASAADRMERFILMKHSDAVDPRMHKLKQELDRSQQVKMRKWSPWHSRLMYPGYMLALTSYVAKLIS